MHQTLREGDVRDTGLDGGRYDLAICSLVDEHVPDVGPLYAEAARLVRPGGAFVLAGLHPFFVMASGMPTHFDGESGPVAIETHVHLPSEHLAAARAAGLVASELHEAVVDDAWVAIKPGWDRYRNWPISFVWVWRRPTV